MSMYQKRYDCINLEKKLFCLTKIHKHIFTIIIYNYVIHCILKKKWVHYITIIGNQFG